MEGDVEMKTEGGLDWKFSQVFGERADGEEVQEVDIISAIEFDKTGDHLATGDRGGRVVLFERTDRINDGAHRRVLEGMDCSSSRHPEFRYRTEFQSHEPEFDYLKSLEIEEKINKIRWCHTSNGAMFLLSTNDKTVKFWKVQEKKIKKICNFNVDPQKFTSNGFISSSNVPTSSKACCANPVSCKSNNGPILPGGITSLRLPMVTSYETSLLARCRRTYAHAHDYHINSISNNSDGETFISADDLRINLWNLEISSQSFNIVDVKPPNMEDLTEVITSAEFHPSHCNMLAYSSSKGSIRLLDLRQSALCDTHSKLFEVQEAPGSKSFFTDIISSISDIKFAKGGRYILSRDYMTLKLWDINMDSVPVATFQVHEHLRPGLNSLSTKLVFFFSFFVLQVIIMGVVTMSELKPSISGKRSFRPSSSTRHVTEWPISDVSSDLTVEVGAISFALHKFPLVSKSGRIRKMLMEVKDSKVLRLNLHNVPGGSEAFELAAKFSYGINIEINLSNVAKLHCTSHFLEMTEEYADKNLETRTETFLKENVLPNITNSISVLHCCENLLPVAEEISLVTRLITSIANNACKEQLTCGLSKLESNYTKPVLHLDDDNWWGKKLTVLNLEFFQRVLTAVKTKGLKQDMIAKILMNYAHNSLQGLFLRDPQLESQKKHRVIVEVVVSLLPTQSRKSTVPMAFLSSLLKSSIMASTSTACRSDLERRIGLQLDQAILEDILIPANAHGNNHSQLYDTDSIFRIFSIFLNLDEDDDDDNLMLDESEMVYDFDTPSSPKQSSILKVSKLLDCFLTEIAIDANLPASKFIALAELLPDHARLVNDGLYRAVDIFLKVHPNLKDSERYRMCKTIDCQKLSQEACSHAAQNERLPVQMAVQVLYFEQIRLRNAMNGGHNHLFFGSLNTQFPQRSASAAGSGCISPRDNYASVRRENRELKLEVTRMRMRLTDLEKDHVSMKQELVKTHPANKLFRSLTKKLAKLNTLFRFKDVRGIGSRPGSESRFTFQKRRRNSIA